MPKALEQKLKREADKKGLTGKRKNAYVYGTLRETGWKPSTQKKAKTVKPKPLGKMSSKIRTDKVKSQLAASKKKRQQKRKK